MWKDDILQLDSSTREYDASDLKLEAERDSEVLCM
jgi:hypothetical protein